MTAYQEKFQRSMADPSSCWLERAGDVHWLTPPRQGIETLPIIPGSPTVAVPGYDVQILDNEAKRMPSGENCYVFVMARTDDVINLAGHRLSTGVIEKSLSSHPDVAGKILRATLRSIADSTDWNMPATIEDPSVLEDITQSLRSLGLAKERS